MKKLTLHIKNMVCSRCIKVVYDELKNLGVEILGVELGYAYIKEPTAELSKQILKALEKNGFEIIKDENTILLEKIKLNLIKYLRLIEDEKYKAEPLSKFLTTQIGKNYSLLSKHFSKHTNKTLEEHFINLKIERVKELLDYEELSLSQISARLRYSSVHYLSSQFKKVTGQSASSYRKGRHTRNPLDIL